MSKNTLATLLLLLGTIFWGMTFVIIKEGVSVMNIYTFLGVRFVIASIILSIIFYKNFKNFNAQVLKSGIILSLILFVSHATQTIGLQYTSASKSAFISGLAVVLIPLILAVTQKKIPQTNHIISVVLATIGLAILTGIHEVNLNKGDIYTLISSLGFAIYIILASKYSRLCDALLMSITQMIMMGILNSTVALVMGEFTVPSIYIAWQAIIFTALFATAFTYPVLNYYQKYVSEIKTAIIFSFEPLFAVLTAYFYQNEAVTIHILIGGLFILMGMIISEIRWGFLKKS